jgi:hypothetical protein
MNNNNNTKQLLWGWTFSMDKKAKQLDCCEGACCQKDHTLQPYLPAKRVHKIY